MSEISSIDIGLLGPGNTSYRDPGTDGQPGGRREPDEHLKDRLFGTILTARNLTRLSKGPGRFAPWCVEHGRTALRGAAGTLGRGTFHNGTLLDATTRSLKIVEADFGLLHARNIIAGS